MSLQIEKDGNYWDIPKQFHLVDPGAIVTNIKFSKRSFSHGAKDISDKKTKPRTLELEGTISAENDSNFNSQWNELAYRFNQKDFKLIDGDKYINIISADIEPNFDRGLRKRFAEITIKLRAEDPFWYLTSKTEYNETISENPHEWNVENGGTVEVYPILTITNNGSYTSFSLKNKTDGNSVFTYDDANFANGESVEVDCQKGTVYRATTNTIRYFTGAFLRLLVGINTLEITDLTNATCKIEFYRRYL